MTNRLDIAALITIVGEDKLREELDSSVWYYQRIDISSRPSTQAFQTIHIAEFAKFVTKENPLKYLIFNEIDIINDIIPSLPEDPHYSLIQDDILAENVYGDETNDFNSEHSEYIWNKILELPKQDLRNLLKQYDYTKVIIYNSKLEQILPLNEYNTDPIDEFINKWF